MVFRKWVPQDNAEYAGCIIVVLLAGVVTSGLRMLRGVWETHGRIANSTVCPPPLLPPLPRAAGCLHRLHGSAGFIAHVSLLGGRVVWCLSAMRVLCTNRPSGLI